MGRARMRLTYRDLKLALLGALEEQGPVARAILVGAARRPGLLDAALERPLPGRDRVRAEEALDLLLRDGLVTAPDEQGVRLTAQGREALSRSCLDPLDLALHRLDPGLVERRASAWAAVAAGTEDALRAAADAPGAIVAACLGTLDDEAELDDVTESAADLALALDRRLNASLDRDEAPASQDVADAIRVAEIVIRRILLQHWQ